MVEAKPLTLTFSQFYPSVVRQNWYNPFLAKGFRHFWPCDKITSVAWATAQNCPIKQALTVHPVQQQPISVHIQVVSRRIKETTYALSRVSTKDVLPPLIGT